MIIKILCAMPTNMLQRTKISLTDHLVADLVCNDYIQKSIVNIS